MLRQQTVSQPFADEDADVEFRKYLVAVLTKRAGSNGGRYLLVVSDTAPPSEEKWIFRSALRRRLPKPIHLDVRYLNVTSRVASAGIPVRRPALSDGPARWESPARSLRRDRARHPVHPYSATKPPLVPPAR